MQGQPLGGARTDAGQSFELLNQPGEGAREAAQESAASGANLGAAFGASPPVGAQVGRGRPAEWDDAPSFPPGWPLS